MIHHIKCDYSNAPEAIISSKWNDSSLFMCLARDTQTGSLGMRINIDRATIILPGLYNSVDNVFVVNLIGRSLVLVGRK